MRETLQTKNGKNNISGLIKGSSPDVRGGDPVLQLPVVVKVESSWPAVQRSEGDIAARERRNVGEL